MLGNELVHFSKTCKLWSSKAAITNAFYAAVKHNYDHEQQTLKQGDTQNGSKSANHKPWSFEPVGVNFCFLRGLLIWLTAAKKVNISWLLNFRIHVFMKRAVMAITSWLETRVLTKGYLWWRIVVPSTVWRRIRRPLSWCLTRDCGRSFYGIVLRTSQGTFDRIRGLTSRARDIGMLARAAKWSTWKCLHVRSVPYNKWEDRI